MNRNLLILLLTLFQDNYVRLGTIAGTLVGYWSPVILQGESGTNTFILGFIGWGIGAYLANYKAEKKQFKQKKKFEVFQGGR